jgi:3-deoxy-manno-octulosonate cytidylyltransferase (CMP-KDO synthetase)
MQPSNGLEPLERARRVRLVVLDIDGVLTDGSLYISADGKTTLRFNVRDGLGIQLLIRSGIEVVWLSARETRAVSPRAAELGVSEVIGDATDKLRCLHDLAAKRGLSGEAICYVGDDLLDVPCLRSVGLAVAVRDAADCAKACAHYVTLNGGGRGAVREVAQYLLDAQSILQSAQEAFVETAVSQSTSRSQNAPEFGVIIPARFGSSRLPGKPLRLICGKPLIVHVYQNALRANAEFTIVATDDTRIAEAIRAIGGDVELTSSSHRSGTDRLAEVAEKRRFGSDTVVVNLQGDEPLLDPANVRTVAESLMRNRGAGISTLATPIRHSRDVLNPNIVKVVIDQCGYAKYFSRAPIPWVRDAYPLPPGTDVPLAGPVNTLQHIGVYGYRTETLLRLASLPACDYENAESLEQLRALYWNIAVHVSVVERGPTRGVDTEEDLRFVEHELAAMHR